MRVTYHSIDLGRHHLVVSVAHMCLQRERIPHMHDEHGCMGHLDTVHLVGVRSREIRPSDRVRAAVQAELSKKSGIRDLCTARR